MVVRPFGDDGSLTGKSRPQEGIVKLPGALKCIEEEVKMLVPWFVG
jgi:hypothetical protein